MFQTFWTFCIDKSHFQVRNYFFCVHKKLRNYQIKLIFSANYEDDIDVTRLISHMSAILKCVIFIAQKYDYCSAYKKCIPTNTRLLFTV